MALIDGLALIGSRSVADRVSLPFAGQGATLGVNEQRQGPGYEFEVPRGPRHASGPRHELGHDPRRQLRRVEPEQPPRSEFGPSRSSPADAALRQFRRAEPEQPPKSSVRAASGGVLSVMRGRNWVMGLAVPIVAAIVVGIAVVVITGGGGSGGDGPVGARRRLPARPARRGELYRQRRDGAGDPHRDRRGGRHRGGGGRRERRTGALVLVRRRRHLDARGARRAGGDDRGGHRPAGRGRARQRPAGWPSAPRSRGTAVRSWPRRPTRARGP